MPLGDWEFWVVTGAGVLAALYVLREVLPAGISPFRKRGKGVKTSLTVEGRSREEGKESDKAIQR